ncbi:transposase [Chitinophaga sp. 2R12]|uniref:Transposase n=1 Tax=Chitinophaga hostae TaxID=2831022 RepID=A0ABS5IZ27_9BACT|nr:transposase [Chitinophaga hostae]
MAAQDGRQLRRYKRRWKIERFFTWLNAFKRVIARYDREIERYQALIHLAFALILMRRII